MNAFRNVFLATLAMTSIGAVAIAQADDEEDLKMEALQALMSAPPERALPIVAKVLKGNGSDDLKEHALFVLGQFDLPEARALLIDREAPLRNGFGEHGVEQRDVVAALAQVRRCVEGAKRRVRLLRLEQFRVEAQVVRLAEQQIRHGSPAVSPSATSCDRRVD